MSIRDSKPSRPTTADKKYGYKDNFDKYEVVAYDDLESIILNTANGIPQLDSNRKISADVLPVEYADHSTPYGIKAAKCVLASPADDTGVPVFRQLTAADLPSIGLSVDSAKEAEAITTNADSTYQDKDAGSLIQPVYLKNVSGKGYFKPITCTIASNVPANCTTDGFKATQDQTVTAGSLKTHVWGYAENSGKPQWISELKGVHLSESTADTLTYSATPSNPNSIATVGYLNNYIASSQALIYKGTTSVEPSYTDTTRVGWMYVVAGVDPGQPLMIHTSKEDPERTEQADNGDMLIVNYKDDDNRKLYFGIVQQNLVVGYQTGNIPKIGATFSTTTAGVPIVVRTDGTITTDSNNKVLGSAAFENINAFDVAGTGEEEAKKVQGDTKSTVETIEKSVTVLNGDDTVDGSVNKKIKDAIAALNATVSQTSAAGNGYLALSITEADGKITAISGSVDSTKYDAAGAASTAESNATDYVDARIPAGITKDSYWSAIKNFDSALADFKVWGGNKTDTNPSWCSLPELSYLPATLSTVSGVKIATIPSDKVDCISVISAKEASKIGDAVEGSIITNGGIAAKKTIHGSKIYNAVWNDLTDCIEVDDDCDLEFGKCYCFDGKHYYKSDKYAANNIIGIHSDTAGFEMGQKNRTKELKCSVAGFVLAYVDKEYKVGTVLTCTKDGCLTRLKFIDRVLHPERMVATYWKSEPSEEWGDDNKIKVNGRKWVKIH